MAKGVGMHMLCGTVRALQAEQMSVIGGPKRDHLAPVRMLCYHHLQAVQRSNQKH